MTLEMNRRTVLRALGMLGAGLVVSPFELFDSLGTINRAYAQTAPKKYLVVVRTLFDFRDEDKTNYNDDLAPLAPWRANMTLVEGLSANGDGSEYHNGKQIRFATSCTPTNRTNETAGGGQFDGKSVDVVVGSHLQATSGARHPYLVLGAYPYSDAALHATFETISFANKTQYIRPEYQLDNVQNQITSFAQFCDQPQEEVDVVTLENENRVLERVMLDISRSSEFKAEDVREQAGLLESQFLALRDENSARIVGAPTCINAPNAMLTHDYNRHAIVSAAFDNKVRTMNYVAAQSLKSNFANVVTLNYNFSGHGQPGVPAFHEMTHPGGFSRPPTSQELQNLDGLSAFQVQMFAHLLRELNDFGVLENTLVVYAPHERPTHDHLDVPVLAHGANKTGALNSNARVQDICKDILDHFAVPGSGSFGGETSNGGVLA